MVPIGIGVGLTLTTLGSGNSFPALVLVCNGSGVINMIRQAGLVAILVAIIGNSGRWRSGWKPFGTAGG